MFSIIDHENIEGDEITPSGFNRSEATRLFNSNHKKYFRMSCPSHRRIDCRLHTREMMLFFKSLTPINTQISSSIINEVLDMKQDGFIINDRFRLGRKGFKGALYKRYKNSTSTENIKQQKKDKLSMFGNEFYNRYNNLTLTESIKQQTEDKKYIMKMEEDERSVQSKILNVIFVTIAVTIMATIVYMVRTSL
jgi:hypothetical protein